MRFSNYIIFVCFITILFPMSSLKNQLLSNEDYVAGEDGVIRMYININGHVKYPGTYLVYDGIDFMTALSLAGGYLPGSDIKKMLVIGKNRDTRVVDLKSILENKQNISNFIFKPHDTVYIEEKFISKLLNTSNLPSILLSILNVALTLERTD